jgi:hypothetical protein
LKTVSSSDLLKILGNLLERAEVIQCVAVIVASDFVVQFTVWPVTFDCPKVARAVGFNDGVRAVREGFNLNHRLISYRLAGIPARRARVIAILAA